MRKRKSLLLALLASVSLAPAAHAAIIFADDFNTGTSAALNGQAPQTRPGTETWRAGGVYTKNTGTGVVSSTGSGSANLAMPAFDSGTVYTLTGRVFNNLASSDGDWVGIGWTTQTTSTNAWNVAGTGTYWMFWRGNNEIRFFQGAGAVSSSGATSVFVAGESNVLDLRVVLDLPANTFTAQYKNPSAATWTTYTSAALSSGLLNGIKSVGFTTLDTNTGIESFELTAVPEPASLALLGLGGLTMLRRRRD